MEKTGKLTVPGKVLFYGGYSVLIEGHISYVIAVVDEKNEGVNVKYSAGEERIISKQFSIDREPSFKEAQLVDFAYLFAKTYLKAKGVWKGVKVELSNSPIFGKPGEKSGLGSSAAATVGIIKALFEANGIDSYSHIETIHKLSQLSYATYAEKTGSGFDIAVSSFGKTIIYHRFDPSSIIMPAGYEEKELLKAILLSIEKPWKWVKVNPVGFPEKYSLAVFNIKGASTSTISAVKAWKQWKKVDEQTFLKLMERQNEVEKEAISALLRGDDEKVRLFTHKAREVHREMQEKIKSVVQSFEEVEPEELKEIIDEAENLEGVIAGRCPGGGGWDSIAFITSSSFSAYDKIEEIAKEKGITLERLKIKVL